MTSETAERNRKRRRKAKERLVDLFGGKCKLCGYSKVKGILVFHHMDPSTKLFKIAEMLTREPSAIEEEAKKCILLCPNCHEELHNDERK